MNKPCQIKAELFEGQHDALIQFYKTYSKLFVNKLLMRLCEGCLDDYPPRLAQFESGQRDDRNVVKNISIRIHASETPKVWAFYQSLPYGAKNIYMVNLLNHYAQLAEADRTLLEQIYWQGSAESKGPTFQTSKPASEVAKPESKGASHEANVSEPTSPQPPVEPSDDGESLANTSKHDPLVGMELEL